MKKLFILLTLLPVVCYSQKSSPVKIKETNHGMYSGTEVGSYNNTGSPTGGGTEMVGVLFFPVTDTIEMKKGNHFGIEFIVESKKLSQVEIEVIWTYPSVVTNYQGEKFTQLHSKRKRWTNEKTFTGYHFDEPYELVAGEWKLELYYKKELLHTHIFFVK